MYNVLPQEYRYRRNLCISTSINLSLLIALFSTHGSISINSTSVSPTHTSTISIQKYRVLHQTKPASLNEEAKTKNIEKTEGKIAQKKDIVENTIRKNPQKKSIPAKKARQEKSEVKTSKKPMDKSQEHSTQPIPNSTTTQESLDSIPVTAASHFGMNNEPPQYPIISFQLGEYGNVVIEYIISQSGNVKEAKIIQSSGYIRLDKIALLEFQQWKFKPSLNATGMAVNSKPQKITFAFDIKTQEIRAE